MLRIFLLLAAAVVALSLSGCFGDRAADRKLEIYQIQSTTTYTGPFEIDLSQLPHGAVKSNETTGGSGTPVTSITIDQECPFRVVFVPIDKSKSNPPAEEPPKNKD
jgi:hypothetical protein